MRTKNFRPWFLLWIVVAGCTRQGTPADFLKKNFDHHRVVAFSSTAWTARAETNPDPSRAFDELDLTHPISDEELAAQVARGDYRVPGLVSGRYVMEVHDSNGASLFDEAAILSLSESKSTDPNIDAALKKAFASQDPEVKAAASYALVMRGVSRSEPWAIALEEQLRKR